LSRPSPLSNEGQSRRHANESGGQLRRPLFTASLFSNPRPKRWHSERPASAVGPPASESCGSQISVVPFWCSMRPYMASLGCTPRRFHMGRIKSRRRAVRSDQSGLNPPPLRATCRCPYLPTPSDDHGSISLP
jgi:hypothetical protein